MINFERKNVKSCVKLVKLKHTATFSDNFDSIFLKLKTQTLFLQM